MRRNSFWFGALGLALVLALAWGFTERVRAEEFKKTAENGYHRSLSDLVINLDTMETSMAKSRAAGSPVQQVYHLAQVWNQSETALKNLSGLPAEEVGLGYVEQLLNQVGEYTQSLTRKIANGESMTAADEKTLATMHERILQVSDAVQTLYTRVNTEELAWVDPRPNFWERLGFKARGVAEAAAEGEEGSPQPGSVRAGLDQLNASLQKLPPISYEGQTDTHTVPEPLGLPDKNVNQSASQLVAQDFLRRLGVNGTNLQAAGTSQGPLGGFVWQKDQLFVEVSKRGGVVTFYTNDRDLGERRLEVEEAKSAALNALRKLGWENLVITSVEDFGSYLRVEAVLEENGVRLYPDKIRMSIARDNGEVIAYDASAYYAYHHDRDLRPRLSLAQAKAKLRPGLEIKEQRLAVIPKPGQAEAFCYEFRGTYNDEEFLIYINAQTGAEENIQRILKTPHGEYLE